LQAAHGEPAPPVAEPPATVITEPVEAGGTDDADEAAIDDLPLREEKKI
jgi:hypothetical protein